MNEFEQEIDNLTEKELVELIDETNDEYDNWNINIDKIVENLPANSKIFLSDMIDKIGEKIFYIIYGYLNTDSLIEYDEMTSGGMSSFIKELDTQSTLNFIELIVDFKKQEIELIEGDVDFTKIISKLKRDVATLKKKLAQPSKLINTKQFEERYGFSRLQQKGLRGQKNPIPYSMMNQKTIMYEPEEVEKWLENYKGRMKIN